MYPVPGNAMFFPISEAKEELPKIKFFAYQINFCP